MTRNKSLTNLEFLKELEKRLPDFTEEDFLALMKLFLPYQQKFMKLLQATSPQVHDWWQQKSHQLQQEKTDKTAEKLKGSLADK